MKKVSVIVPVYNVEQYLEKCLESLASQTLDDYEVIVVNDGSPDNSQMIIDEFTKKYPDVFKSFVKENGGLSDARNYGLKQATGEYISFIDSDDYVSREMLLKMYEKAKKDDYDMVVCDINYVFSNVVKVVSSNLSTDMINKNMVKQAMKNIYPAAWNKIYKRNLFDNNVQFKKGVWYEDVEFLYRLLPYVNSIGTVKEPLVFYVQRENSIIKTYDERLYNYIDNFNGIVAFYKEKGFYDEYYNELEYCYVRYLYGTFVKNAANFNKEEYNKAVALARKNVKLHFPHYRRNLNFYKSLKGIYLLLFGTIVKNLVYFFKKR